MKKIIYEEETGIAVMTTTGELTVEKTALKDVPYGRKFKIIDASDLPQDRTFRGAWEFDFSKNYDGIGGQDNKNNKKNNQSMITINIDKAKNITKERLRIKRKLLLEAEDIKFMQAQETGSDTTAIVAEKKRLRDITKNVDSCTTTDELKALNCTE